MKKRIKKNKEKLYKQARGYLRTFGALVGRDTTQPLLSSTSSKNYYDSVTIKEAISRMAAVTCNYLMQLWQTHKNGEGWLIIENLNAVADVLGITTQRLKLYLVCLGGYEYPIFYLEKIGKDKNKLSITHEKLCRVVFNFNLKDNEIETTEDIKVGTRYLHFIKDRIVTSIELKPTETTVKQLYPSIFYTNQKKGLGNVLVSDSFVALCLGLSDMAYKLLCYTGSNKPTKKIVFNKIIKPLHLNLEKQLKQQGKPRLLKRIKDGFKELKNTGHIKEWYYNETKDMFAWEYTEKVFKHPDFKREENSET